MNALDLMERLGGEILSNKIRAVIDGEIVVLARMEGVDWVMTERGQTLANEHSNQVVAEQDSKPAKPRKAKEPAAVEPVAVESADAAIEM
jgi:hypothetical protein